LPDGSFSNQKSQFGEILDGLGMEKVGIFFGHLIHFWPFGNLVAILLQESYFGAKTRFSLYIG
jgi:hypothetical protein